MSWLAAYASQQVALVAERSKGVMSAIADAASEAVADSAREEGGPADVADDDGASRRRRDSPEPSAAGAGSVEALDGAFFRARIAELTQQLSDAHAAAAAKIT
jgi:hypothetical protein